MDFVLLHKLVSNTKNRRTNTKIVLIQKIGVSYGNIKKISKHFDKKTLLVLYNSLIISHIRYCITTWHIGNKNTASKIQQIANKFVQLTFGLHHRANVTDIL